jgi:hypothetical protein
VVTEDPEPARKVDPSTPEALSHLCVRALSRRREERPRSAREVAEGVRAWQAERAADREREEMLHGVQASLDTAERLVGAARLTAVDRAAGAIEHLLQRHPGHEATEEQAARARALRAKGIAEQGAAASRRARKRVGMGLVALAAIVAFVVAGMLRARERETRAALLRARALALAAASREAADAEVAILLAREAARLRPMPETVNAVRLALARPGLRAVLAGHGGPLAGVAFAPDGERIVTAGQDGTARVWSRTGEALRTVGADRGAVAWPRSPSGRTGAS